MVLTPVDARIDLHLHTIYSDGQWRPRDLFERLTSDTLSLVSVVDHDQLDHLPEVQSLGMEFGITVIPGVEMTARWRETAPHILCYAPIATGFTSDALRRVADRTRADMIANTLEIYATLRARGVNLPSQSALLAPSATPPTRAGDVARLLIKSGLATTSTDAMAMVIDAGYRQATAPLADVIDAAHASGAVCLLAHPGRGDGEIHRFEPDEIDAMLREASLDGIEVYYPAHTAAQVAEYAALAERHELLVSAGSDSHGPHGRPPIATPARHTGALLARLGCPLAPR